MSYLNSRLKTILHLMQKLEQNMSEKYVKMLYDSTFS